MDALHGPDERGPAQGIFTELHDEAAECSHVGLLTIGAVVSSGDIVGVRPCDDDRAGGSEPPPLEVQRCGRSVIRRPRECQFAAGADSQVNRYGVWALVF